METIDYWKEANSNKVKAMGFEPTTTYFVNEHYTI